jgi:hypothetical protein
MSWFVAYEAQSFPHMLHSFLLGELINFYDSVLDFLGDLEEKVEVGDLLNWWNW